MNGFDLQVSWIEKKVCYYCKGLQGAHSISLSSFMTPPNCNLNDISEKLAERRCFLWPLKFCRYDHHHAHASGPHLTLKYGAAAPRGRTMGSMEHLYETTPILKVFQPYNNAPSMHTVALGQKCPVHCTLVALLNCP